MEAPVRIRIALIYPSETARTLNRDRVKAIASSIAEIGLRTPITVRPTTKVADGREIEAYEIVAGQHRYEAAASLGWEEMECFVTEEDELHSRLWEIDENLMRAELTHADRAEYMARRKEIYEALYPETKHGSNQHTRSPQNEDSTPPLRFTADAAAKTGKSEATIQRDTERGEKICDEAFTLIRHTKLDKGVYLDELKKLSHEEQVQKIYRDLQALEAEQKAKKSASSAKKRAKAADSKSLKEEAEEKVAALLAENIPGEHWDALKANLHTAGAGRIAREFERLTGVSVFDNTKAGRRDVA